VIPEIRLVVCANAADNGWLEITDVWLVTTDRFECDAIIISCARAGRAGGVLSISIRMASLISHHCILERPSSVSIS
jgi:hypothetical protein